MSEFTDAFSNFGKAVQQAYSELTDSTITPNKFSANTRLADSILKEPKVLAEHILKKDAISCSITIPIPEWKNGTMVYTTTTIPFYMQDNFGFSLKNEWQPLIDLKGGVFEALTNGISMLTKDTQVTMQSQAMTAASWKGSQSPTFDVKCLFICTNRSINPVKIITTLAKACLPTKVRDFEKQGGKVPNALRAGKTLARAIVRLPRDLANIVTDDAQDQATNDFVSQVENQIIDECGMVAPLNYGIQLDDSYETGVKPLPGTTLALHIGDYFHANNLVVDGISGISFSKELIAPPSKHNKKKGATALYDSSTEETEYGFPLYATCNITLKPYCMVDYKTFMNYFAVTNGSPGAYGRNTIDTVNKFYSSADDILPQ